MELHVYISVTCMTLNSLDRIIFNHAKSVTDVT